MQINTTLTTTKKFWSMIRDLLKKYTGYNLINSYQIIVKWVKMQIKKLVEEKMGSSIEVEQNDFKAAVE